jgi:alanyl-tRNA synthetase
VRSPKTRGILARSLAPLHSCILPEEAMRIYYPDPYCLEFDATVTRAVPDHDRWRVRLDRTAFYPTTGGQPFDTGMLGAARVVDVLDEDGEVDHVTDARLEVGETVRGTIDRGRRLDHMQQHTGQHMLSAAFDHLFEVRTESFHLGSASSTIDLAREVTPLEIARAEDEANRIVWEDRAVSIRFVPADEAASLPLRKEPQRGGELRVIDIDRFDLSACGGTHVARTGEVGIIAVRGWERFKGGTRVEFVCGGRALRGFRELRDIVNGSVRMLSVLPGELPGAIERSQSESKELRRQLRDLAQRLAVHEAEALAAGAEAIGPVSGVVDVVDGYDATGLKTLATTIVATPGRVAALVSATTPALLVIARSPDVSLDAAALVGRAIARFGGKGGGRPDLAQAGGLSATPQDIAAALRTFIAGP